MNTADRKFPTKQNSDSSSPIEPKEPLFDRVRFDAWLEQELDELVNRYSDFVTSGSRRRFFRNR